jgi:hypothetical protein
MDSPILSVQTHATLGCCMFYYYHVGSHLNKALIAISNNYFLQRKKSLLHVSQK